MIFGFKGSAYSLSAASSIKGPLPAFPILIALKSNLRNTALTVSVGLTHAPSVNESPVNTMSTLFSLYNPVGLLKPYSSDSYISYVSTYNQKKESTEKI